MKRKTRLFLALIVAAGSLLSACAPPEQYAKLATAGRVYAAAMDALLVASQNVRIDATSETILQGDLGGHTSEESLARYNDSSAVDRERIQITNQLRAHVRLLDKYFLALHDLATSDAPERASSAVEGLVGSINGVGNSLRQSSLIDEAGRNRISLITSLIVGARIRGKLKDELEKRKETIQKELATQEVLLDKLAKDVEHALTKATQARETRKIIEPLVKSEPVKDADAWVKERRVILTTQSTVTELTKASNSVKQLREAFEDLTSGKLSLERVNSLIADFGSILAVIESFKQA